MTRITWSLLQLEGRPQVHACLNHLGLHSIIARRIIEMVPFAFILQSNKTNSQFIQLTGQAVHAVKYCCASVCLKC